jgi:uncharacterized protein DUF6899
MPYIEKPRRERIHHNEIPSTAGELNYAFVSMALDYLDYYGLNYQHMNDVIGALEGAKMEIYRRQVAPYEDRKAAENGDVKWIKLS